MSSETLGALPKLEIIGGNVHYGRKQALFDVAARIADRSVSALIGPSGCGKTTFLNCLNRMIEAIEGARFEGAVLIDGAPIYDALQARASLADTRAFRLGQRRRNAPDDTPLRR